MSTAKKTRKMTGWEVDVRPSGKSCIIFGPKGKSVSFMCEGKTPVYDRNGVPAHIKKQVRALCRRPRRSR